MESDFNSVRKLKGSKKYKESTREIALKLFRAFAKDWEAKQALLPQHIMSWYHKNQYKKETEKAERKRIQSEIKAGKKLELQEKDKLIQKLEKQRLLLQQQILSELEIQQQLRLTRRQSLKEQRGNTAVLLCFFFHILFC